MLSFCVLAAQASEWIESDSCPEFIVKAEECLKREEERVGAYLHKESKPKVGEGEDEDSGTTKSLDFGMETFFFSRRESITNYNNGG